MLEKLKISFIGAIFCGFILSQTALATTEDIQPVSIHHQPVDICSFIEPENPEYKAHLLTVRKNLRVNPGEVFTTRVFMKNTGNMPWFSADSLCQTSKFFLGTERTRDRNSDFYQRHLQGWQGGNRIKMDQERVNPGEIASFTFQSEAPNKNATYKEYFAPVVSEVQWLEDSEFSFETIIGNGGTNMKEARLRIEYGNRSGDLSYLNLNAEKTINVKLSEQKVYLKLGDEVIREFRASTGKARTPTPVGTTTITLKQDVRIGGASPHYIMPRFMWFRAGGYGFHALPSVGSARLRAEIRRLQAAGEKVPHSLYYGDALWTEAHEHIGIPVSHGCVRLLPDDADWMYDFVEIGTKVVVER
jgi:hypothetical protein